MPLALPGDEVQVLIVVVEHLNAISAEGTVYRSTGDSPLVSAVSRQAVYVWQMPLALLGEEVQVCVVVVEHLNAT
jgi:hypothetical protein